MKPEFDEWVAAQEKERGEPFTNDQVRDMWRWFNGFDENRMDVIGQNGNGGEHYDPAI